GAGSNPLRVSQNAGLKVDAVLNVTGASTFNNNITTTGNFTVGGKRAIRAGDRIKLEVNSHNKELYLYCETGNRDNVYGGSRDYSNATWRVHYYDSRSSVNDASDGQGTIAEPDGGDIRSADD
ncbi:hypothetical protein ACWCY1_22410, partial [Streptomyces goshikiensis]